MTNDHIQKWLARSGVNPATQRETEAEEIIRFLAGPDGSLQFADDAAWELIMSETSGCFDIDRHAWYDTTPASVLLLTDDDIDLAEQISRALRYLHSRGLLICHPNHACLVRWGGA